MGVSTEKFNKNLHQQLADNKSLDWFISLYLPRNINIFKGEV
jgi:hypothetical protein